MREIHSKEAAELKCSPESVQTVSASRTESFAQRPSQAKTLQPLLSSGPREFSVEVDDGTQQTSCFHSSSLSDLSINLFVAKNILPTKFSEFD